MHSMKRTRKSHLLKLRFVPSEAFLGLLLALHVSLGSLYRFLEAADFVPKALDDLLVIAAIPHHTVPCLLLPRVTLLLRLRQVRLGDLQLPLHHVHTVNELVSGWG